MTDLYLVGGAVRDIHLGLSPKDYDFTVVADSYEDMKISMREAGAEFFLEAEDFGTIRASIPVTAFPWVKYPVGKQRVAADFVLARKDGVYSDGRRPDTTEPGSLYDDLARRDFTVNAMAIDNTGILIDPFRGAADLSTHTLRAVGNAVDRLTEDALRTLRAIRFAVTKGFVMDDELKQSLSHAQVLYNLEYKISKERVREELYKCFKYDTLLTIKTLESFPLLRAIVLGPNSPVWLEPTSKER